MLRNTENQEITIMKKNEIANTWKIHGKVSLRNLMFLLLRYLYVHSFAISLQINKWENSSDASKDICEVENIESMLPH